MAAEEARRSLRITKRVQTLINNLWFRTGLRK